MKKKHKLRAISADDIIWFCMSVSLGYCYVTGTLIEKVFIVKMLFSFEIVMLSVMGIILCICGILQLIDSILTKKIKRLSEKE